MQHFTDMVEVRGECMHKFCPGVNDVAELVFCWLNKV